MKTNQSSLKLASNNPLANPVHARIASIDNVVIVHAALKAAIEGLVQCISWSDTSKEPRGAILVGVGGTGKTTICNAILKKFPIREEEKEDALIRIIPAFYASVPSPSTIKSLAANLLESMGAPSPRSGTAIGITARLCGLLKTCQTKIIFLDEFHHLLSESAAGGAHANKVCNWLKSIINKTGVMVCLVGMPACEALVNFDSQMSRRFTHRFRLDELAVGTAEEPGPLQSFLLAFSNELVQRLALKGFVDFSEHLSVVQIWAATSGNPAFITLLLKEATAIALSGGRNVVVLGDLADAYSKGITRPVAKISGNPFCMTTHVLGSNIDAIQVNKGDGHATS